MPWTGRVMAALAAATLCSACAVQPVSLSDAPPAKLRAVAAKAVVVDDLSRAPVAPKPTIVKAIWHPIPDQMIEPKLSSAFAEDLRTSLRGTDGGRELLQVSVLEAGLYYEVQPADLIPYINLLAALREHRYLCKATISLRQYDRAQRFDLTTREFPVNALFGDIEMTQRKDLVLRCKAELLEVAQERIDLFLSSVGK